jgi:ATP-dependent DNA helicase RecG
MLTTPGLSASADYWSSTTATSSFTGRQATTDGFALANEDLRLRGPGELVGTRQSGRLDLYLADLGKHPEVVAEARRDALDLFDRDPTLADATLSRLKKLVVDRWGETLGLGDVG